MRLSDLPLSARAPRLTGLALLALTWMGCPPPTPGNSDAGVLGDPPQVAFTVPDDNAVGSTLKLSISVSGCDSVKTLALYDHDQFIKKLVYTGAPTLVDVPANEVPYNHNMAAQLSLTVRAWCADGRTNVSAPQGARFFPVAQIISSSTGAPVVPDYFYAEGSGAGTVFIGCNEDSAGRRSLVKVDLNGNIIASNTSLPFPCSQNTVYTEKNALTGTRWMWDPGVGAMAYDSNLNVTSFTTSSVKALGVGPDGDALIYEDAQGGAFIQRIPAKSGTATTSASPLWSANPLGAVLGTPVVNADGTAYVAYFVTSIVGGTTGTITVQRLDYVHGGKLAGQYDIKQVSYGFGDAPPSPPIAFSSDGTIIYVPNQLAAGQSEVLACSTAASGCSGAGSFKWRSPTLTGDVALLMPYASGSRIAAITLQHEYFLRADTGLISGGGSIDPDGALVANGVQPGLGRDFYLLFGQNVAGAQALEVVGLDNAEQGEVFRYSLLGGSLTAAVADDGQVWLRIGKNLVKPFPLAEYRLVK